MVQEKVESGKHIILTFFVTNICYSKHVNADKVTITLFERNKT